MPPLIAKIEALITPDITPDAAQLLRQAVEVEMQNEHAYHCDICGNVLWCVHGKSNEESKP